MAKYKIGDRERFNGRVYELDPREGWYALDGGDIDNGFDTFIKQRESLIQSPANPYLVGRPLTLQEIAQQVAESRAGIANLDAKQEAQELQAKKDRFALLSANDAAAVKAAPGYQDYQKAKMTPGLGKAGLDMYFGGSGQYEGPSYWYKRKGFKDTDIRQIQQQLIDLGYNVGRTGADGKIGANTIAAIKQFQKDNGLAVDGKFGGQTRLAMQRRIDDAAIEAERKTPRELLSRSVVPGSFAQALPKLQLLPMTERNEARARTEALQQFKVNPYISAPYENPNITAISLPELTARFAGYGSANDVLSMKELKLGGTINYQKIFK